VKLLTKKFFRAICNTTGFNTSLLDTTKIKTSTSISDAFIWRTDGGYKTIFKFLNLLKLYYWVDHSNVILTFYDNDFKLIKIKCMNELQLSNELVIEKQFLNNYEGYGIFYIFHKKENLDQSQLIILSDRSYLGFSHQGNCPSFVHGNSYVKSENFESNEGYDNFINTSLLMNKKYRIQNNFNDFDKTELFFNNPLSKKVTLKVNKKILILNAHCSKIICLKNISTILIESNCNFIRPIVFNYKNKFIDVYHS